jgi:hypothetical protein
MSLWVSYKKKYENNFFFCILKVSTLKKGVGFGSAPKCHNSPTLVPS